MDHQHVQEQLARLRSELDSAELTDERREYIRALIADIDMQLATGQVPDQPLRDQVEGAVSAFEVEHPRLAGILNNIMITLGNMGI
ncbi:MAG: DUF4404 family protein [Spongiibacteraceae bacterium]|jgi:hypothetical protein|nr:DUF4404 family protein [Spongiibacteraceae bacterium]